MIASPSPPVIEDRALVIRGHQVMLDADLATLYGVSTKALNQAVKRNKRRFPRDFMFQLTWDEETVLKPRSMTLKCGHNVKYRPYVFTELGAGMLASVLRGPIVGRVAVEILRAFKRLRPTEGFPGPMDPADRVVGGLFAAIRDAILVLPQDVEFTTDEPYTYFIQAGDDGPIKIGWTKNLLVRLRALSAMWPVSLRLLGVIKGNAEVQCHAQFAAFRLGGEWFMPSLALLDFIRTGAILPEARGTAERPDR